MRAAVPVDCTKPNPADRVAGDKSDCAAFVANATCLRAYDPEGYGYYARIWYSAKVYLLLHFYSCT